MGNLACDMLFHAKFHFDWCVFLPLVLHIKFHLDWRIISGPLACDNELVVCSSVPIFTLHHVAPMGRETISVV